MPNKFWYDFQNKTSMLQHLKLNHFLRFSFVFQGDKKWNAFPKKPLTFSTFWCHDKSVLLFKICDIFFFSLITVAHIILLLKLKWIWKQLIWHLMLPLKTFKQILQVKSNLFFSFYQHSKPTWSLFYSNFKAILLT